MKRGSRSHWVKTYVKGKKILDIGFAGGSNEQKPWYFHQIIRENNPNSIVIGIDLDKGAIEKHPELVRRYKGLILADGTWIPLRDGHFDIVFMGEVLEHVWNPLILLQETHRVLKNGGLLVITTPNPYHLANVISFWFKREFEDDPDHKIIYDLKSLSNLIRYTGFRLLKVRTIKIFIPFLKKIFTSDIRPFSHMGANLCVIAKKT